MDAAGRILRANRHIEVLLGRGPRDHATLESLVTEESRAALAARCSLVLAESEDKRPMRAGIDLVALSAKGDHIPVELSLSTLDRPWGRLLLVSVRDTRVRRAMGEELLRSNAALQGFTYVASHDMQEPLRMVISYCQLLQRRYADRLDDDGKEFLAFAVDGAVRMRAMVNSLLDYARLDHEPVRPSLVELEDVAARVVRDLTPAIRATHAKVVIEPLPRIRADPVQMGTLFQNLVSNALKFHGPEPPVVVLRATEGADAWTLRVEDNGIGIQEEDRRRVFEVFTRLHARSEYRGSGIGLATCRRIVTLHGGRIWAEANPPRGTAFCFTLPHPPTGEPPHATP